MYLKIVGGSAQAYSLQELRQDNPNTSFPLVPPDATLAGFDVYPYEADAEPAYEPLNQTLTAGAFYQAGGAWKRAWVVADFVPDEISQVQFFRAAQHPSIAVWDTYSPLFTAHPDWAYLTRIPRADAALNASANGVLGEVAAQGLLDAIFRLGVTL